MEKEIINKLALLFEEWSGDKALNFDLVPPSGSNRQYVRISNNSHKAIGAYNTDLKENKAFIHFSEALRNARLPVPQIFSEDLENNIYLIEDLGHTTLFDYLTQQRIGRDFTNDLVECYKKVLALLPSLQIGACKNIDFSLCYPRHAFDKQSILWDLSYFKYYFLKLAGIAFDEQELENDFETFSNYLLEAEQDYFLFRDFQSRNIMLDGQNNPSFIDYQGGRKGALQYDVASLLFDGKADIPQEIRDKLLEFYLDKLSEKIDVDRALFKKHYQGYVLVRIMQAMGAYGYRGFFEQKSHFLQSIPYAIANVEHILDNWEIDANIPHLKKVLSILKSSEKLKDISRHQKLHLRIFSFSYRKGIPKDKHGNGGGFVFDCRAIKNPGMFDEYKKLSGQDAPVKQYLETQTNIDDFLANIYSLIRLSIRQYSIKKYSDLSVYFGCTGGQHRSVYSAKSLTEYVSKKFPDVDVSLIHLEQENWKK
ncbi:MAG: phosphotransferase [Bacteroidales bacterium]